MTKQNANKDKASPAQSAPDDAATNQVKPTDTTTQQEKAAPSAVGASTPSLVALAMAISMGEITNEAQEQAGLDLWDRIGCEAMPPKLAVAAFDCAYDQGAQVCERLLAKIGVGDGKSGVDAISELDGRTDDELVTTFLAWRLRRYAFTGNAATKMLEWSIRVLEIQALKISSPDAISA